MARSNSWMRPRLPCQRNSFYACKEAAEFYGKTESSKTRKGLPVAVEVIDKVYSKGTKVTDVFKQHMPIVFDDYLLSQWNYTAVPQISNVGVNLILICAATHYNKNKLF